MKQIDFFKTAPAGMGNLSKMELYFKETAIDPILKELIKTRVSQINGCAFCLNMHTIDALKIGETAQRMFLLNAWRETNLFNDAEKAVLDLTEHVTLISETGVPEDVVEEVLKHFSEKDFVDIMLMIIQINAWNRINIALHNDIDTNYK